MTPEERDQLCQLAGVQPSVSNKILGDALVEAINEMAEHVGPEEFQRRIRAIRARQQASQTPAPGAQGGAPAPVEGAQQPGAGQDVVAWAVETGRISPDRAAWWSDVVDEERRRSGSAASVEATLRSLAPVYADTEGELFVREEELTFELWGEDATWIVDKATGRTVLNERRAGQPRSATPLLDSLERDLYGPTREEREAAEDRAGEAELAAQLEEERAEKARAQQRAQVIREHREHEARTAAKLDRLEPGMTPAEERRLFGPEGA